MDAETARKRKNQILACRAQTEYVVLPVTKEMDFVMIIITMQGAIGTVAIAVEVREKVISISFVKIASVGTAQKLRRHVQKKENADLRNL